MVFCIIVTYNGSKWIDKCFGSLVNSSIPVKVLAIDNASTDGTPDIIRKKFPHVEVIETGENLGFGKANNIGLKRVLDENADYAFLLNQDAWVNNNTLATLIEKCQQNNQYGIISPMQFNDEGSYIDDLFFKYTISQERVLISDYIKSTLSPVYEVEFVNAACWLIPINTLKKVGGFDPLFPHYGEDNDLINRIKNKGLKIGLVPQVYVFHDRETRINNQTYKYLKNKLFIQTLIVLKNPTTIKKSRLRLLLESIITVLRLMFSTNKIYYLSKIAALFKIIGIYGRIYDHKQKEVLDRAHYLI